MTTIARYGWKKDGLDPRDRYLPRVTAWVDLPPRVDLTPQCPPVQDQGQLGSCTAFADNAMDWFVRIRERLPDFRPSELFTYFTERVYENTVSEDSGAQVREGLRSLVWNGACPADLWPYDVSKFTIRPPHEAYVEAAKYKVTSYLRVAQQYDQMCWCLASGYPFAIGFLVYPSFESQRVADTGVVPAPTASEIAGGPIGGHAVMVVGYDRPSGRYIVRNSWSDSWGMRGYFTVPCTYFDDPTLASDLWTIRATK